MTTSTWSKLGFFGVALVLMGQSCSISLGNSYVDGGVFRSDDHGSTWKQVNKVSTSGKQALTLNDVTGRSLVFNPNNSDHLYLGTLANGIWQTTDRGDHWSPTSLRSGAYECLTFDSLNPQVMYTSSGQFVLKSVDGGVHWLTVYTEPQPNNAVNCVAVNPMNSQEVYATTSGGKVLLSSDYGVTWTLMYTVTAGLDIRRLYIPTDDAGTIYIFTRANGIIRGANHGRAWTDISDPLKPFSGGNDIRQVEISASGWYLATAFGLLKSTDRAKNWKSIPIIINQGSVPLQDVAVNPQNSQEIFIVSNQQLHHSTDGGATWAVRTLPTSRLPVLLTFDPSQPDRLYFATFKQKK